MNFNNKIIINIIRAYSSGKNAFVREPLTRGAKAPQKASRRWKKNSTLKHFKYTRSIYKNNEKKNVWFAKTRKGRDGGLPKKIKWAYRGFYEKFEGVLGQDGVHYDLVKIGKDANAINRSDISNIFLPAFKKHPYVTSRKRGVMPAIPTSRRRKFAAWKHNLNLLHTRLHSRVNEQELFDYDISRTESDLISEGANDLSDKKNVWKEAATVNKAVTFRKWLARTKSLSLRRTDSSKFLRQSVRNSFLRKIIPDQKSTPASPLYLYSPHGENILMDNYEFFISRYKKYAKRRGLAPGSLAKIDFVRTRRRNLRLEEWRKYLKLFPQAGVSAFYLNSAISKIKRHAFKIAGHSSSLFTFNDSSVFKARSFLKSRQTAASVAGGDDDEVSGGFFGDNNSSDGAYRSFLQTMYAERVIAALFSTLFIRFANTAFSSLLARRSADKLLSNEIRSKEFYKAFSYARSAAAYRTFALVSSTSSEYKNVSPYISPSFLVWSDKVTRRNFSRLLKKKFYPTNFSKSVLKSFLSSRGLFFNNINSYRWVKPGKKNLLDRTPIQFYSWMQYYINQLEFFTYRFLRSQDIYLRRRADNIGFGYKFSRLPSKARDNLRDYKAYVLGVGEGRIFSLLQPGLVPGGLMTTVGYWEPRERSMVFRDFPGAMDPFASRRKQLENPGAFSPFSLFNNFPNTSKSIKILARFFFSIVIAAFRWRMLLAPKSVISKNWRAYSAWGDDNGNFIALLERFLHTLSREYRSIEAQRWYTLAGAGNSRTVHRKWSRRDGRFIKEHQVGVRHLSKISAKAGTYSFSHTGAEFEMDKAGPIGVFKELGRLFHLQKFDFMNSYKRIFLDNKGVRAQAGVNSLPISYAVTAENNSYNFTSRYSSNRGAILKMFFDFCSLLDADMNKVEPGQEVLHEVTSRVYNIMEVHGMFMRNRESWRKPSVYRFRVSRNSTRAKPGSGESSNKWQLGVFDRASHVAFYRLFIQNNPKYNSLVSIYGSPFVNFFFKTVTFMWLSKNRGSYSGAKDVAGSLMYLENEKLFTSFSTGAGLEKFEVIFSHIFGAFRKNIYLLTRKKRGAFFVKMSKSRRLSLFKKALGWAVIDYEDRRSSIMRRLFYQINTARNFALYRNTKNIDDSIRYAGDATSYLRLVNKGHVDTYFGKKGMKRRFVYLRSQFMHKFVLSRRLLDHLNFGLRSPELFRGTILLKLNPLVLRESGVRRRIRRRPTLFKHNPDAAGRSRALYYVRKKSILWSRGKRPYAFMRRQNFTMGYSTAEWSDMGLNAHMRRIRMERAKRNTSIKLKRYYRHAFREFFSCSTNSLRRKFGIIKHKRRRWLAYYKLFESYLWRYIRYLRLIPNKHFDPKGVIRCGLVTVNGVVCVNPYYIVNSGDVLIFNNEAYWSIVEHKIGGYIKKYLPYDMAPYSKKRVLLARALQKIRNQHEKGAVTAVIPAAEQEALNKLQTLFVGATYSENRPAQKKALGGPQISNEDIYASDTSFYSLGSTPDIDSNRVRLQKKVESYLRLLNDGSIENGKFYYRFQNAIYVIRAPHSAKEMFSRRKLRRFSPFYNHRAVRFLISHRFWW